MPTFFIVTKTAPVKAGRLTVIEGTAANRKEAERLASASAHFGKEGVQFTHDEVMPGTKAKGGRR